MEIKTKLIFQNLNLKKIIIHLKNLHQKLKIMIIQKRQNGTMKRVNIL